MLSDCDSLELGDPVPLVDAELEAEGDSDSVAVAEDEPDIETEGERLPVVLKEGDPVAEWETDRVKDVLRLPVCEIVCEGVDVKEPEPEELAVGDGVAESVDEKLRDPVGDSVVLADAVIDNDRLPL